MILGWRTKDQGPGGQGRGEKTIKPHVENGGGEQDQKKEDGLGPLGIIGPLAA